MKTSVIVAFLMLPIAVPVKAQTQCCPFAGATNLTYSSSTGAVSIQPMSGQDAVPFSLAPGVSSPKQDIFDVFGDPAMTTKVLWVDGSGNLNFAGNNATYGAMSQNTASWLHLYGGSSSNGGPYLYGSDYTGSYSSYLYFDPTVSGQMSIETGVHSGAATANDVICTHGNKQCSGGSGSVTSVGLSLPAQFNVSQSPVTSSGTLTGVWATLGTRVTGDPNFPGLPALLTRRVTLMEANGSANLMAGVGDYMGDTGSAGLAAPSATFPDDRNTMSTGTTLHTPAGWAGSTIYRTGLSTNGSAGLFFDARVDVNGATADYHTFLGLTDQPVANTMPGTSSDCKYKGIYAAISACTDGTYTTPPGHASTDWVCVTNNADGSATTQSATDSGVAFGGNEHRFAIWEDVVNAKWHFYIDGSEVCGTGVAANYPSATNLKFEYGALNTTTTAITLGAAGFQVFSN